MNAAEVTRPARRILGSLVAKRRVARHPGRYEILRSLRRAQWLSPTELAKVQEDRIRRLVAHAYTNVPYYRQVMVERGIQPSDIRSKADLVALPLLTKAIIRNRYADLRAIGGVSRPGLVSENHTGGSTGVPLDFLQDENYRDWGMMELQRDFEMCGYRLGDPIAFLWGSDYDARPHKTMRGRLRNWATNTLYLDAFDATEQDYVRYGRRLAAFRPALLVGYVSSLVVLARVIRAHRLEGVRPRAIQSSAETLTPPQRELIEATFRCRVFDRYGCREVGNIAHECDHHSGLHALEDNNVVEVLLEGRAAKAGEAGDLIVTNLHNYAMPLIRYVIGDMAVPLDQRCSCGRGLPLLREVTGRRADVIRTPSGRILHGEFFTHLFYKTTGVREFQVVQRTPVRLNISIVPDPTFDHTALTFLESVIHEYGDPAFDVQFTLTDAIPRSASGKFRFTLSDVAFELEGERSARP